MPVLTYPTGDFQPFTKILSSEVNGKFNAIKTLLNTTGLDSTNVQVGGLTLTRLATGTANYAIYRDGTGVVVEGATLPILSGGTGLSIVTASQNAGDVLQVNAAKTALELAAPTGVPASLRVFQFNSFA